MIRRHTAPRGTSRRRSIHATDTPGCGSNAEGDSTMSNARMTIMALGALLLAGCEQDPVRFDPDVAPRDGEAAELVARVWGLLPDPGAVEANLIEALSVSASDDAIGLILEAGDLMAEANDASREGDVVSAQILEADAEAAFEAAMMTEAGPLATQVVSDVEAALGTLSASDSDAPGVASSIAAAAALAQSARGRLAVGDAPGALRDGLAASDRLRHLNPEERARAIVANAVSLLERAKELAGPDPRPEVVDLLREADERCESAVRALESDDWGLAVREAHGCARLARRVIVLLSGGSDNPRFEERAIALVEQATELYLRAVDLAGDDPSEEVARALEQALVFLNGAKDALEDEDWREAIRQARESIAISHRVIGFLSGDRPGDRLEARAHAAVDHAIDLYERAVGLAGHPPRPEVQEQLEEARSLIDDAQGALANGDWPRAIVKSKAASAMLIRVIRVLA